MAQFSKNGKPPDYRKIKAMAEDIHHRGPDDEGFYNADWFGLGFKRLSIIDLSMAGHQPMLDETKRFVLVYNGELYNHKELKKELITKGYVFSSNSDTEVVLKSFIEWSSKCLDRFSGMFSFIVCDLIKEEVFLARDHLGIKPLYYYEDNENILFASEIKSFRHFVKFEVNKSSLYEQFYYRYVSGNNTIFHNIFRVPAGTYFKITKAGIVAKKEYYDVTNNLNKLYSHKIETSEIARELKLSVFSHTQSDVGYNIQLSGGLDSSYITSVLADEYKHTLNTYSVALSGFKDDESRYQEIVSKKYRTNHHSYAMDGKNFADNLMLATWHMDIPIIHTACVFLMVLCKHSRETSKVILTGEGADELFGGYSRYNISLLKSLIFSLKKIGLTAEMIPSVWKLGGLRIFLSQDMGTCEQIISNEKKLAMVLEGVEKKYDYRSRVSNKFPDLLRKIIASDQTIYLNSLLERQDKMAMAMSVETRVPFCTHHLFDMVNMYNPSFKAKGELKKTLKLIAEKYYSKEFVYRKKVGFTLPLAEWLREKDKLGVFLDLLSDRSFKERGFYNIASVNKAVNEHLRGINDWSKELVILILFECWYRIFIENQGKTKSF